MELDFRSTFIDFACVRKHNLHWIKYMAGWYSFMVEITIWSNNDRVNWYYANRKKQCVCVFLWGEGCRDECVNKQKLARPIIWWKQQFVLCVCFAHRVRMQHAENLFVILKAHTQQNRHQVMLIFLLSAIQHKLYIAINAHMCYYVWCRALGDVTCSTTSVTCDWPGRRSCMPHTHIHTNTQRHTAQSHSYAHIQQSLML